MNNNIQDLLNKELTESDIFIHGNKENMKLLVMSYSNYEDQFTKEFERSLSQNGIPYILAGSGEKWIDFRNRTIKFYKLLKYYLTKNSDLLVICCDCNDVLFFQDSSEIIKKYDELTPDKKILVVGEQFCNPGHCPVKKCTEKTVKNNKYYPNGGFIMGPINKLIPLYEYLINRYDDQIGLGEYVSKHCDDFVIDYNNDILLLDVSFPFGQKIDLVKKDGKIYDNISGKYPCAIHILGISFYPKKRSEHYRNLLFEERDEISKKVYDDIFRRRFKISKTAIVFCALFSCLFVVGIFYYISNIIGFLLFIVFICIFIYCMTFYIDL